MVANISFKAPLEQKPTKQFLTFVFVDIVQSTKFFEDYDQEDISILLNNFLKTARDIIENSYGFVNQTMGDGFVAVFGFNKEQEDKQIFWACWAAQKLIKETEFFKIRISINSGFASYIEKSHFPDVNYHFVGDALNIAGHIVKETSENSILIGESARPQASKHFFLRKVHLKNRPEISCSELVATIDQTNKFLSYSDAVPFYYQGRDKEVALLANVAMEAFETQTHKVHIYGDAGIGKTTFISRFLVELSKAHNISIISYSWCPNTCRKKSVIDIFLDQILRSYSLNNLREEQVNAFLKKNELNKKTYRFCLLSHMNVPVHDQEWNSLPEQKKDYVKANFVSDLLHFMSLETKTVVIFDDMQWADQSCNILFETLHQSSRQGRFLLLSSSHNSASDHAIRVEHSVYLKALVDEDVYKILLKRADELNIISGIVQAITSFTAGNPYYINLLIDYFKDNKEFLSDIDTIDDFLPPTIDNLFINKLSALSAEEQFLMKAASVIGINFRIRELRLLLHGERIDVDQLVSSLEKKKAIVRSSMFYDIYQFTHSLAWQATHRYLTKSFRLKHHQKYLASLTRHPKAQIDNPYALLAYHAFQSDLFELAYIYSLYAGHKALDISLPEKGIKHYKLCIQSAQKLVKNEKNQNRLVDAYLGLAKAYCLNGNANKARKTFLEIKKFKFYDVACKSRNIRQKSIDLEIAVRWIACDYDRSRLKRLEHFVRHHHNNDVGCILRLGAMLSDLGRFKESNEVILGQIIKFKDEKHKGLLFPAYSSALADVSRNYGELGQQFLAQRYATEALSEVSHFKFSPQKIYALTFSASHLVRSGQFESAYTLLEEAYVLANQFNVGMIKPFLYGHYAIAKHAVLDCYQESDTLIRNMLSNMEGKGFQSRRSLLLYYLARINLREGEYKKALEASSQSIKTARSHNEKWLLAYNYRLQYELSFLLPEISTKHKITADQLVKEYTHIAEQLSLGPLLQQETFFQSSTVSAIH